MWKHTACNWIDSNTHIIRGVDLAFYVIMWYTYIKAYINYKGEYHMKCKQCNKEIGYLVAEGYFKGRFMATDWDFEYTDIEKESRVYCCPLCNVVLAIKEQEAIDLFVDANNKKAVTKKGRGNGKNQRVKSV